MGPDYWDVHAFVHSARSFVHVSNFIEFEISRIESNDVIVLRIYRVQIVSFYYKFIFWFRFLFSYFFFPLCLFHFMRFIKKYNIQRDSCIYNPRVISFRIVLSS